MNLEIPAVDPDCCEAAREYLNELAAAGLPLKWQLDIGQEHVLQIKWGITDPDAKEGWEDQEESPSRDDGLGRMVGHYMPNVHLLASDAELAREWLSNRRSPKPRPK